MHVKKSCLKLILIVTIAAHHTTSSPVVILTHGVLWIDKKHPHKTHWFEAGGNFFDGVKQTADLLGHTTISYRWQQPLKGLTSNEHKKAAHGLCDVIKKHLALANSENDRKIIIIAHSMGGKVAALASNFLYNSLAPEERPTIEALFTLGTPHLKSDPQPNMHIINKFFNIVSMNDKVTQGPLSALAGTGSLPDPIASHERAATFILEHELLGQHDAKTMISPGHHGLHNDIVGSNLLKLIHLTEQKNYGFSKFSFLYNGRFKFFHNGIIEYEPVL